MAIPLEAHWVAVKCIMWYLKGTISHGLQLYYAVPSFSFALRAYYDVDWATDPDDHRCKSGAAIYLVPNLVSWWSRKQVVVWFSTVVEYRSLARVTIEFLWIETLLIELGVQFLTPRIYCDY
uniref:Retrovirus-related Pol polyprotein from transposon TNT 1-94 n=1 Tax=Cajanus cajan TaxID=3821 RepID=A0A151T8J2_CAJCA|nr:Retrovirus-related Pol polyprotein from transposon TNT 1-94 [Cajanus cajan]